MADDASLITRSLRHPEAFADLFDRHYDPIAGYLRRRLEPSVAEDLAAQTFLIAFEGRAAYDRTRRDAAPWLYGIATNLLRRHHRSESRRWKAYAAHGLTGEVPAADVDAQLDARAAAPALAGALAKLKRGDRDALLLLAWADLGYAEIAASLDIPVGTVRSRINRARRLVTAALGEVPGSASLIAAPDRGSAPTPPHPVNTEAVAHVKESA